MKIDRRADDGVPVDDALAAHHLVDRVVDINNWRATKEALGKPAEVDKLLICQVVGVDARAVVGLLSHEVRRVEQSAGGAIDAVEGIREPHLLQGDDHAAGDGGTHPTALDGEGDNVTVAVLPWERPCRLASADHLKNWVLRPVDFECNSFQEMFDGGSRSHGSRS